MAIFGTFGKKTRFLAKKGDLCFCTPLQCFGLVLRVSGVLGGAKNEKKHLPKNHCFFEVKKRPPKPFFVILGSFLGSFWEAFRTT